MGAGEGRTAGDERYWDAEVTSVAVTITGVYSWSSPTDTRARSTFLISGGSLVCLRILGILITSLARSWMRSRARWRGRTEWTSLLTCCVPARNSRRAVRDRRNGQYNGTRPWPTCPYGTPRPSVRGAAATTK